eukprot:NODE_5404_length_579_cov_62.973585_g4688_i0.p1 GENE.NODE_5404_length_579_cov_62.973585_g4688_i0~~NODE_5404_length_579_cov_62.973585_g4688_i0.p1  ORF type:complete len:137 (-),score=17.37 NODE_5404_length_579_cov_62.973585_g4688_i0:137-547(-)
MGAEEMAKVLRAKEELEEAQKQAAQAQEVNDENESLKEQLAQKDQALAHLWSEVRRAADHNSTLNAQRDERELRARSEQDAIIQSLRIELADSQAQSHHAMGQYFPYIAQLEDQISQLKRAEREPEPETETGEGDG